MRSKSQSVEILLLGIALFVAMQGFGRTAGGQDSPDAGSQKSAAERDGKPERNQLRPRRRSQNRVGADPARVVHDGRRKRRQRRKAGPQSHDQQALLHGQVRGHSGTMASRDGQQSEPFQGREEPRGPRELGGCPDVHQEAQREVRRVRRDVRPADRGSMGIRLPRGSINAIWFWRQRGRACRVWLVRGQRRRQDASGGRKEAERLGTVRHARQRLGVVRRLVRRGLLQAVAHDRPGRADGRHVARASRRLVERPGALLPLVVPLLPPAVVLRPLLRTCASSAADPRALEMEGDGGGCRGNGLHYRRLSSDNLLRPLGPSASTADRRTPGTPRSKDRGRRPCGNCSRRASPGVAAPKPRPEWPAEHTAL